MISTHPLVLLSKVDQTDRIDKIDLFLENLFSILICIHATFPAQK